MQRRLVHKTVIIFRCQSKIMIHLCTKPWCLNIHTVMLLPNQSRHIFMNQASVQTTIMILLLRRTPDMCMRQAAAHEYIMLFLRLKKLDMFMRLSDVCLCKFGGLN